MARLVCTPLGQSARGRFCGELRSLPRGEGVLVVPNRLLLEEARRQYGVECVGIDTLASKILNLNGYVDFNQINRRSQEIIIEELLEELQQSGEQQPGALQYFAPLATKPGFVHAMTSLLGQLGRSGSTQEQISGLLSAWGRSGRLGCKDMEVALLYAYYRSFLRERRWFDLEGKYRLALKVLRDASSRLPWQQFYFSDFYSFDSLQLELIKALAARAQVTVGLCWEKNLEGEARERSKLFAASKASYMELEGLCLDGGIEYWQEELDAAPGCRQVLRNLGRRCEPLPPADEVQLYAFSSREQELRWVLAEVKKLLRQGVRADRILIAARKLQLYSGLRLAADEYGLPVTLAKTSALAVQPLSNLLMLLLQAKPDTHEGAEAYFALIGSELGRLLLSVDGEAADRLRQQCYFSRRSSAQSRIREILPQKDEVLEQWDSFLEALPASGRLVEYCTQVENLLQGLQLERRLGALYKQGRLDLEPLAAVLKSRDALLEAVRLLAEDYRRCGREKLWMPLGRWQELLAEAVAETELVLRPGREDGVLVTEAVNVQGLAFDYVFLMGLREGEFPSSNNENWIYNDRERKELQDMGLELPNTSLSYAEDACFFGAAAAAARRRLTLTCFADEESGPSPYMELVQKLFLTPEGEPLLQQDPPREQASPEELSQLGLQLDAAWLKQQWGEEAVRAASVAGRRAEDGRFGGCLQDEALQRQVRQSVGTAFSASGLELYAACPFRFLGERVWAQQGFAARDEQLSPADEGDLLHQALARFLGRHLNVAIKSCALETLQQELDEDFASVCRSFEEQGRIADSLLWQVEAPRLHKLLRRWLQYEYEEQEKRGELLPPSAQAQEQEKGEGFLPCALEWEFSSKNGNPLPLLLQDGSRVTLNGRIDRLDSDGERLLITDYKRSASSVPSGRDLQQGFDVQLPVYLLAAANLYPGQQAVAGGGYLVLRGCEPMSSLFLQESGGRRKDGMSWESFRDFANKLLQEYIEGIYSGAFAVAPRKKCSEYCPLQRICRVQEMTRPVEEGGAQNGHDGGAESGH